MYVCICCEGIGIVSKQLTCTAIEKARDHGKHSDISLGFGIILESPSSVTLGYLVFDIPRKFSEEGIRIPPWNKIDVL